MIGLPPDTLAQILQPYGYTIVAVDARPPQPLSRARGAGISPYLEQSWTEQEYLVTCCGFRPQVSRTLMEIVLSLEGREFIVESATEHVTTNYRPAISYRDGLLGYPGNTLDSELLLELVVLRENEAPA